MASDHPMCSTEGHGDRPAEFEIVETFCGVGLPPGRPVCAECAQASGLAELERK